VATTRIQPGGCHNHPNRNPETAAETGLDAAPDR
jgi:hypothetical protein